MTTTTQTEERFHRMRIHRAADYMRMLRKRKADYAAAVDEWYRSGDGRSPKWVSYFLVDPYGDVEDFDRSVNVGGRGYRYPACIHGVTYTEFDCDCGACEDGTPNTELALAWAHQDVDTYQQRFEVVRQASALNAPRETVLALVDWAVETIQPVQPRPLDPKRLP